MFPVIETEGLTKQYDQHVAVDTVSIQVGKGEIYGFLGLNGAGKTTMIRMMLGMITPTDGICRIAGTTVSRSSHRIWEKVGYMVENPYSYPELTVIENLEIIARLRNLPSRSRIMDIIGKLKLTPFSNKKAKHLSLGNAQRLGIAKALLHEPEILILDEPTNGLDPAGMVEIRELLQEMATKKGTTIFISSHILSEVSKIATKIGIIHNGRLIQEVASSQLNRLVNKRLVIEVLDKGVARSILEKAGFATVLNQVHQIEVHDDGAILHPETIAALLVNHQCPPTRLAVEEEDLESYFLRIIRSKGVEIVDE